ncbi:response regulator [Liquorilactobacillus nagelii]|uniref:Two-component system chemotaxis family response regulator CheY n=1 Tax=Liquorilactobacillus nagelii TaxID=82688 RepID=A0A0A7RFZ9_9LACO|nr:response regulator [Liquorilactobacillus nagelii]AJA34135.1 two-component system chemotaxis family response regulator CheY [Liquorilactobacillus nagelii]AUJ33276.1 two-component system response regulator [Liquorilactobacillus nagelii]MCC7616633.1 response regulator [Liquorilactobacillus nagelii]MCI1700062.1 response regulator [Liquorilactobacillus nagelii]MCI1920804.1 response regulator [Liquorilactobacillus nagelii]
MGKKILIVDDAVFMRIKLKDILEKNGYEVAGEAQNGQEAFDQYQEVKPDLVTMDITMPEVDGLEALKMIRKADANAKVIMCSAMGQQGMVMDAIRAGAIDFIVKPFDTERVIKALDKAFS